MALSDTHKSKDWYDGYTTAMVWLYDLFDSHSSALVNKGYLHAKDLKLVLNAIDAFIKRRELISDVGPRGVNMFVGKGRSVMLKEK